MLFRSVLGASISSTASGIQAGHSTCEKNAYTCVITVLSSGTSYRKVNQITPSLSCWIANSMGIAANISSRGCLAAFSVSVPIPSRTIPAEKLAVAEKHIQVAPARVVVAPTGGPATRADLMPASLVRLSISALMATTAELPDIDSAASSGESVKG